MDHSAFMDAICKKLQELPPERKDAWIMEQAKMVSGSEQQDFLMSLSGEKKITYMPTEREIGEFCQAVHSGDIFVEYEKHYYEFDSDGRYMDDWKTWHNDPKEAFPFLDRVFRGCHDLLRLGEYKLALKILDKACCLEFRVVEAEDSEDFEDDSPFTIADAAGERKFSMDIREIGHDWLEALLLEYRDGEEPEAAEKILEILQDATGGKINPSDFGSLISDELLAYMEKALGEEIGAIDMRLGKFPEGRQYWQEQYRLEKARARKQHLLLDIRKRCRGTRKEEKEPGHAAGLDASWKQIRELARTLNYKENTDDRLEIDEIEEICQALIKRGRFEEEEWGLRKEILRGILSYGYYNCRGFHKPLKELAGKLYITDAETLEYADLLNEHDIYAGEAAELYRRYGKTEKYVRYLETHLGRSSKAYVELTWCYCDAGNETRARETAEQGLKQCKDDLTDLFIFLLRDARKCKDKERYKKLYASAKRRKGADIVRVDAGLAM